MTKVFSDWTFEERAKLKNRMRSKILSSGVIRAFDIVNTEGQKPFILAFEDETVESVLDQAKLHGGRANLVVLFPDSTEISFMRLTLSNETIFSRIQTERLNIQPSSHIGMLVHYAETQEGRSVSVSFKRGDSSDFSYTETVSDGLLAA